MSAESPRRSSGNASRGSIAVPVIVPPQVVSDRSILDSAIGFINEVTLSHQPPLDPKDTITWARFETTADISDPRFGEDWELEGNVAPPLLLILGYGLGVQVWAIPANGEAIEVLSWRHGIVSTLKVLPTPLSATAGEENSRADEPIDLFGEKRPLIALVEGSTTSGSQPQFCAVNFVSLKTGAQVKTIKFKNPVIDILANRSSVVVTFHERIAVFDARTLEDRLSITTCYPSPGINPNPAALGHRWLAYAENKLLHTKRSGGGCDGDGVTSYTATVLNASKSLVKGLRELGEQVAAGFTGTSGSVGNLKNASFDSSCGVDAKQAGIVTIIDVKNPPIDYSPTSGVPSSSNQAAGTDTIIAHFIAHSEALVAMEFDNSGMLLVTADRRGHDFHVFRIQPNPVGSSLAAVHHLYILHRGDTSAKVQNITLSLDSRWVAVSTLRGTTHVFPVTPYGGTMGVRTHTSLHVVNKLSRFHRSAGLSGEGRSNSPISHSESTTFSQSLQPYNNSTLPPFPRPAIVMPLAQLRQPFALGSPPGSASIAGVKSVTSVTGSGSQRQRLSSLSDDSGKPLSVCAIFAKSRSWLLDPPNVTREAPHRMQRKAVDSLFVMAGHGALIQYDLDTKLASNVVKEKICDDTPIELEVEAKAQWNLGRRKEGSQEIMPPLSTDNWLVKNRNFCMLSDSARQCDDTDERSESWLSQVEIITHAGPHRRLWMGPQFVFKTYNTPSGSNLNHVDIEAVEIGTIKPASTTNSEKLDHSNPLNMPLTAAGRSSAVPVLIESGSYSSIEQSPKLMDRFRHDHLDSDYSVAHGDSRLKEDLADAMRESPSATASTKETGGHAFQSAGSTENVAFYDALATEDDQINVQAHLASAAALANVLPNIRSYEKNCSYEPVGSTKKTNNSIEKIVNPLGTVTTITSCLSADVKTDILDEVVSQLAAEDTVIHENCDESLFRPVVAIFCDEKTFLQNEEESRKNNEKYQPSEIVSSKLVVPVIAKEMDDELSKREREKISALKSKTTVPRNKAKEQQRFEEMTLLNTKPKESKKLKSADEKVCDEDQGAVKKSQRGKTARFLQDIEASPHIETNFDKKETLNEMKMKTKKEVQMNVKHTKEQQEKVVTIETNVDVTQEIKLKKQANKEMQDPCEENKNNHSKGKDIRSTGEIKETKIKSKLSNISKQNEEIIGRNEDHQSSNEMNSDLKSTSSFSCKVDEKCLTKTKSEANSVSTKNKTAIKEKVKKTKDSNKNTKLGSDKDPAERERETEKAVEYSVYRAESPFVCEKNKTFENIVVNSVSTAEKESQYVQIDSSEIKTLQSCKSLKEIQVDNQKFDLKDDLFNKEHTINEVDVPVKREFDLPHESKKVILDESIVKEVKTCSEIINLNNECKNNLHQIKSDEKVVKKTSNIQQKYSDYIKSSCQESCEKNTDRTKADKEFNLLRAEKKPEQIQTENDSDERIENLSKSESCDETISCNSNYWSESNKDLRQENFQTHTKQEQGKEVKSNSTVVDSSKTNKELKKNGLPDTKPIAKDATNVVKDSTLVLSETPPKKKGKESSKSEIIKRKISNQRTFDKDNGEKKECKIIKENNEYKTKPKCDACEGQLVENTLNASGIPVKDIQKLTSPVLPRLSAWKTLSGADMINQNLNKYDCESDKFPSLGLASKIKNSDKLLPELPTPADKDEQTNLDEFLVLKSLDPLPPLPDLEPLELMSENRSSSSRDISLITFESPLIETPILQRKITPAPRGFTEQNLILALCGSLHYENEQVEKTELSPTCSSNPPSSAFEESALGDCKSLTENDDLYISLEQSSQDTVTTATNTNNEKFFSSTNSSGSEEIAKIEDKKIAKKQKRKKQQQLKETPKNQNHQQEIDDEELRPLIAMTDSQIYQTANNSSETLLEATVSFNKNQSFGTHSLLYSATTDSEGPLPATTSDDNVFPLPVPGVPNTHRIKTKKLEHKINLIAAIEAATSSSTSSAEESGVELGGRSCNDNSGSLISEANTISTSTIPIPINATSQTTAGALKKKSKRRKR